MFLVESFIGVRGVIHPEFVEVRILGDFRLAIGIWSWVDTSLSNHGMIGPSQCLFSLTRDGCFPVNYEYFRKGMSTVCGMSGAIYRYSKYSY